MGEGSNKGASRLCLIVRKRKKDCRFRQHIAALGVWSRENVFTRVKCHLDLETRQPVPFVYESAPSICQSVASLFDSIYKFYYKLIISRNNFPLNTRSMNLPLFGISPLKKKKKGKKKRKKKSYQWLCIYLRNSGKILLLHDHVAILHSPTIWKRNAHKIRIHETQNCNIPSKTSRRVR